MNNKQSSFTKVAEQVIIFNNNTVDILSKLDSLTTTEDPTIDIKILNENGIVSEYQIPSFNYLKSELERLGRNIKSLSSIDSDSYIEVDNTIKKIITVDLNREPSNISILESITTFKTKPNHFFDALVNPMMQVELDLTGKISNGVRKVLSRRYIIHFIKDSNGELTNSGLSAKSSFELNFLGKNNIDISELERWINITGGVDILGTNYDEEVFDLEVNSVLWDGTFNVISIKEDSINRKLWYYLNTLTYNSTNGTERRELKIGDHIILNLENSSSKYKIIEISKSDENPKVRFERIDGFEPIPVGVGTIKYYSNINYNKRLRVSIGYDEYNVIYLKPINADSNLISKNWSLGTAFYTNNLSLNSGDSDNGKPMDAFYVERVYDYGRAIQDLVEKKIPNSLGVKPNPPQLDINNFKVVQINTHLTDSPDKNIIRNKHNYSISLKNEINQLNEAIEDKNKKLRISNFGVGDKKKFQLEISELSKKRITASKLLSSTNQEIIELSRTDAVRVQPKFKLRGFWDIPEPLRVKGTLPQEVIGFKIEYRYVSKDGREPNIESFNLDGSLAVFSNWELITSDIRKREFDEVLGEWRWLSEDVTNPDMPNINQLNISISPGEKVEFRIKSISEVGYPESPIESEWSDIISYEFPDDLTSVLDDNDFIVGEANKEDMISSIKSDLSAGGIDEILSEVITIGDKRFLMNVNKINSGFKDENSNILDLFEYLSRLENRVRELENKIMRVKGELEVAIIRNNQEFIISNNSDTQFNIECEEFLEPFIKEGVPVGRVYANNIYVIKDFAIRIKNKTIGTNLGLLSNRRYSNSEVYNENIPQTFWINPNDELLISNKSGSTKTQLDNQFLWQVNYTTVTDNSFNRISENIGNSFINNSLTNVLGLTDFNIGYSEITPLAFNNSNNSLLEPSKWIDIDPSVSSTNKFLTTIHPVLNDLGDLVENSPEGVRNIKDGIDLIIPINIYFKMNALDNTRTGNNYQWIDLNRQKQTVKHIKKLKFFLENESDNKPFKFTLTFNLNRNKVTFATRPKNYQLITK